MVNINHLCAGIICQKHNFFHCRPLISCPRPPTLYRYPDATHSPSHSLAIQFIAGHNAIGTTTNGKSMLLTYEMHLIASGKQKK